MSVIFIGDREVGKTTLVFELANPNVPHDFVKVIEPPYKQLCDKLGVKVEDNQSLTFKPERTSRIEVIELKVEVQRRSGEKTLDVKWVDTKGEFWSLERLNGQQEESEEWQELLSDLKTTRGIMLVLAPPRSLLEDRYLQAAKESISKEEKRFLDYNEWIKVFKAWLEFLATHIGTNQHILICLNMADLFCDYKDAAHELRYALGGQDTMGWQDRHRYVLNLNEHFKALKPYIDSYNDRTKEHPLRIFITTKENRTLLELPWLYLGNYL